MLWSFIGCSSGMSARGDSQGNGRDISAPGNSYNHIGKGKAPGRKVRGLGKKDLEYIIPSQEVTQAIRDFVVPIGFKKSKLPQHKNRSPMYDWGVRVQPDPMSEGVEGGGGDAVEEVDSQIADRQRFYCMASSACREGSATGIYIKITSRNSSPATVHLRGKHFMPAVKSQSKTLLEHGSLSHLNPPTTLGNMFRKPFSKHEMCVSYVKSHTVLGMEPFDFLEDGERQQHALRINENFPVKDLDTKGVKHTIAEMYAATVGTFKGRMLEAVEKAPLPILHIGLDTWESRPSCCKFV
ncbi:unnamed protein product, partial [Choristocarpus tenellus]